MAAQYSTVSIGLDEEKIHIGNFSFPCWGHAKDFPKKPQLEEELISLSFATSYASEIPRRVGIATATDKDKDARIGLSGVYLDFENRAAVGTNGSRMHILELPMMHVEYEAKWKNDVAGVQVPLEVYRYIKAVEDREWTGMRVGASKVMVGHEDFGLIAEYPKRDFPDWKKAVQQWPGHWVLDREVFLSAVKEASLLLVRGESTPILNLAFDQNSKNIAVVSHSETGERFERVLEASPSGRLVSFVSLRLNSIYVLDALDACQGTSLRIGVARDTDQVTFRGDDNCFTGVVMPVRRE